MKQGKKGEEEGSIHRTHQAIEPILTFPLSLQHSLPASVVGVGSKTSLEDLCARLSPFPQPLLRAKTSQTLPGRSQMKMSAAPPLSLPSRLTAKEVISGSFVPLLGTLFTRRLL